VRPGHTSGTLRGRKREQIVPQPGDDLHWQGIVRRARARRRFRFLGYTAGLTAADLVVGSVAYGGFLHNVAVLVPAASGGSKSAPPTPRPGTGEPDPALTATATAEGPASAIDALLPELTMSEQRTLWEAPRRLIRECMLVQGISFYGEVSIREPDRAKAHGYGFNAKAFSAAQKVPQRLGGGPRLDAKTAAALDGQGPGATIDLPDGMGRLGYSTNGCQADATRRVYGDLKQFYALGPTTTAVYNLKEQVASAPAVSASLQKWRVCMSSQGWVSFKTQPDAFSKVYNAYFSRRPDARELEFSIAPADAECALSSGYGAAVMAAEEKVAGSISLTMARRITAFLEMQDRALTAATTVLKP
jgi:hypothetical protein